VVLPGLGNNAADYDKLAARLREDHGLHVEVAAVKRLDWCAPFEHCPPAASRRPRGGPRPNQINV
jgi:hypothetical protein